MAPYPRFRSDLIVSRQDSPDGTFFVVKDPTTGRFFRLREPEYLIAQQLDGAVPVNVIFKRLPQHLATPPSEVSLESFVAALGRLGLLEGTARAGRIQRQKWFRGSPLYLRLKAFDPDRLLERLVGKAGFLLSAPVLWVSAGAIALAAVVTVSNLGEIRRDFSGLFRAQTLVLTWLAVLLITTAHEFAHALTCKRFGGHVHEMGVMLIYLHPALYCNVSDAWLFPERSKRLWVTFSGAYFELTCWALATLVWRVTDPAVLVNHVALVVVAASGLKIFFNLNPLIKLDGYYLLSDYLEIPNLRQKAFRYLGSKLRQMLGAVGPRGDEATSRERRIYGTYGAVAGLYSFSLIGVIGFHSGGFLMGRYQAWGFVLFAAALTTVFWNPLKKLWRSLSRFAHSGPSGRRPAGLRMNAVLPAALLAAVLLLWKVELTVSGEFRALPIENADLVAGIEGVVEQVFVEQGDAVGKGDPIVQISAPEYHAELQKVEAQLLQQRATLKMVETGPRQEQVAVARLETETSRTALEQAKKRYEEAVRMQAERVAGAVATADKASERLAYAELTRARLKDLFDQGLISRTEFEKAEEEAAVRQRERSETRSELELVRTGDLAEFQRDLSVAEAELKEAESRLALLLAGSRAEEIDASRAETARLEADRRYLQERIALTTVRSPADGIVTTPKLKEKRGAYVKKGDLIAEVYELDIISAETAVPENEIADVRVGQAVALKARAYPEKTFHGKVISIAPIVTVEGGAGRERNVIVTTELENAELLLKPEMTGHARIYAGRRRVMDVMTRRVVRFLRVEFWSWR